MLTDVHEDTPLEEVAAVVDVLQTPAFLCRQTNFIQNVARQGKPVNIKKGQFLAPWDMAQRGGQGPRHRQSTRSWCASAACRFGYNNLVSDMRALAVMRDTGCPVVFDATHSVQLPGGRAAVPAGSANSSRYWRGPPWPPGSRACSWRPTRSPTEALSDGPNAWPLDRMEALLETLVSLDQVVKGGELIERELMNA